MELPLAGRRMSVTGYPACAAARAEARTVAEVQPQVSVGDAQPTDIVVVAVMG
jgi:hypothetical protein